MDRLGHHMQTLTPCLLSPGLVARYSTSVQMGRGKILGPLKLVQTKLTEEANQQVTELLLPVYTVRF